MAIPLFGQKVDNPANALSAALNIRADIANNTSDNNTEATRAIAALHATNNPSGLGIPADGNFAFAAIDVGRRLMVMHRRIAAEAFFHAAEASLNAVINRTPDSSPQDKAQYLEARALIRIEFLNQLADGRSDLDAALRLTPDNQRLRQLSRQISADPAATLKNHQEQPKG